MEMMLLGFCILSLILSSLIVVIELIRDHYKQQSVTTQFLFVKDALQRTTPPQPHRLQTPPNPTPLPQTYFEVLKKELLALGYRTPDQQLKAVNFIVGQPHTQLTELSPQELKKVAHYLQQLKTNATQTPHSSFIPQNA